MLHRRFNLSRISDLASASPYGLNAMDHTSPRFSQPANAEHMHGSGALLMRQWAALQDAGGAVAAMAGLAPEHLSQKVRQFPVLIKDTDRWRQELATNQVADMTAMMQPGLAALLAVNARGQDATAAALTLWREYHAAREAVLLLVPETGAMGPRRAA
ncbi:hypothetical protein [Pontixanthobacter sp.]|uniref:hypothetical protein n=1 Tax=Pontixanthobacter sp. TaxID=2792078 RepID=UPI003C7E11EF